MTFKDEYADFQHLVLNLLLVRRHNLLAAMKVVAADQRLPVAEKARLLDQQVGLLLRSPDIRDQDERLLFAEGALANIALERFLRMILGKTGETYSRVTLPTLLSEATGEKRKLLRFGARVNRERAITAITLVRNTLLHGDYEQLAHSQGYTSVQEFFQKGYTPAVETTYQMLDDFLNQIDPQTGLPLRTVHD